jgi:plastocyanin
VRSGTARSAACFPDAAPGAAQNSDWDVTMPPKKTVTSILKKAGTIEYYCRFHPNMKALAVTP